MTVESAAGARDRVTAAMRSADRDAVAAALTPDVVLRSPVIPVHFEGVAAVADVMVAVASQLEGLRYTLEGEIDGVQVLGSSARLRKVDIDVVQLLKSDVDGRVRELTIYVRPIAGVAALAAALAPRVGRGPVSRVLAVAFAAPLATLLRLAQPLIPRLVRVR